jgi:hypothetical protein
MGGLLVKAMLGCGCDDDAEQQLRDMQSQMIAATAAVVFIATPHHGSWLVRLPISASKLRY